MAKFSAECCALDATEASVVKIIEYVRSRTTYASTVDAGESVAASAAIFTGDSNTWDDI
jgi:hypothetical protein